MAWRLAKSLDVLRGQINALSPNRSKISDGTIGNAEHASRASDHNPWVKLGNMGIVTALDITKDVAHGVDSRKIAEALAASRDERIKYLIADGDICSGTGQGQPAWKWRKYTGANSHHHHFHISVKSNPASFDATTPWELSSVKVTAAVARKPAEKPKNPVLVEGNKGPEVERLQRLLNAHGAKLTVDSDFGPKTMAAVKAFQKRASLVADAKVGASTWEALKV